VSVARQCVVILLGQLELLDEFTEVSLVTWVRRHSQRPARRPVRLSDVRRQDRDSHLAEPVMVVITGAFDQRKAGGLVGVTDFDIGEMVERGAHFGDLKALQECCCRMGALVLGELFVQDDLGRAQAGRSVH
jgi:hypothetical protein